MTYFHYLMKPQQQPLNYYMFPIRLQIFQRERLISSSYVNKIPRTTLLKEFNKHFLKVE